ncbi:MAG: hypothetical protein H7330_10905 [Hymenobacteraceae bacterium]|nr:hypothetical protein [Hymenobacteraceae bacterium]
MLLLVTSLILTLPSWAQSTKATARRSLRTTATTRDSTRADSVRQRLGLLDQQKLLDSLRALSKRKTIAGRVARMVFDFRERRDDDRGLDAAMLDRQYDRHRYKVVRRIDITRLDPFGYSIDNLARVPTRFWEKAGNAAHLTTHRGVVRRSLLFQLGKPLQPQSLSESERLLRATPFIGDARVLINEATSTDDSVDVIVVTKDNFSIGVSASASPPSPEVDAGLSDDNFLGLGHQVALDLGRGYSQPDPNRVRATYAVANLGRQFVQGLARYERRYGYENSGVSFNRGFVTANTRWAGAVNFNWYDRLSGAEGVNSPDNPPDLPRIRFGVQDYWLGRAYSLRTYDLERTNQPRLITAGRVISTTYGRGTEVPELRNTTLVLGSVGLSFRRYYKDRYLFQFGRTEDIPAGNLLTLTGGYEHSAVAGRPYAGAKAALGHYRTRFGYLYAATEVSAYRRAARWEQGLLSAELQYFTPRAFLGTWQWRQLFWARATLGYRRVDTDLLTINQQEGLRGFRSGLARGQRRVVLNYESTLFTPLSFLGLRVAGVFFADVAWLALTDETSPLRTVPYPGVGVGLRLRNDYIAFRTIQILAGYYPHRPPGEVIAPLRFYEAARPFVPFRDFGFTQPTTSEFR